METDDDFRSFKDVTTTALQRLWVAKGKALRAALAGSPEGVGFVGEDKICSAGRGLAGRQNGSFKLLHHNGRVSDPAAEVVLMHQIGFDGPGLIPAAYGSGASPEPETEPGCGRPNRQSLIGRVSIHAAVELGNSVSSEERAPGEGPTLDAAHRPKGGYGVSKLK